MFSSRRKGAKAVSRSKKGACQRKKPRPRARKLLGLAQKGGTKKQAITEPEAKGGAAGNRVCELDSNDIEKRRARKWSGNFGGRR